MLTLVGEILNSLTRGYSQGRIWFHPIDAGPIVVMFAYLWNSPLMRFQSSAPSHKKTTINLEPIMKYTDLSAQEQLISERLVSDRIRLREIAPEKSVRSAHPLFPSHQVFLWLPGLPGPELPFCSCNEAPDLTNEDTAFPNEALHDSEGNLYAPPFPVSHRTYVSWHTHVVPPVPFHPVPIKRFLSIAEMEGLARKVLEVSGHQLSGNSHLLSILRNQYKSYILCFLAHMGVLEGVTPHRK